jgi:glucokinase-like ROK family protein
VPQDPDSSSAVVALLDLVRLGRAHTRPELVRESGLGRNVVAQRIATLIDAGLVEEAQPHASTGGRAPRGLRFRAEAGRLLAVDLGATGVAVAVTDLTGTILADSHHEADVTRGPEAVLHEIARLLDDLLSSTEPGAPVWGVGVGVPGPVEFASGRPVSPPIMPGWDRFPVRSFFGERYRAPTWVDNDVNIMALGEQRAGHARGERDVVVVKVGTGIGAGLLSAGRLHRGAQGCAGDIGHVAALPEQEVYCRCGKIGCLEAVAGGAAIAREGTTAARDGRSPRLAAVLSATGEVTASDVADAAAHGDPVATEIYGNSARFLGETLARIVNFYNPSLIVLGGGVASTDAYTATLREIVYRRSLPLATRDLRIVRTSLDGHSGISGAAAMVADELFDTARLAAWLPERTPAGRPELTELPVVRA